MFSAEYRWLLLHPLLRGGLLTFALVCVCVASLLLAPASTTEREPAAPEKAAVSAADQSAWPRTVLRLWFLAPHILPLSDR